MENSLLFILSDFGATLKNHKNPNLIGTSSNFLHNISTCICIRKIIKMENSQLFIFGEIWPKSLYYSTGTFVRFWSNFKKS